MQSYSHFFSKKIQHICISLDLNFNESLTNDIVSFEQLGPAFLSPYLELCYAVISSPIYKLELKRTSLKKQADLGFLLPKMGFRQFSHVVSNNEFILFSLL